MKECCCLSVCQSVCLPVSPSVHLSVHLSVRLSACLFVAVRLSVRPSVRPSACPSVFPFVCPSVIPFRPQTSQWSTSSVIKGFPGVISMLDDEQSISSPHFGVHCMWSGLVWVSACPGLEDSHLLP